MPSEVYSRQISGKANNLRGRDSSIKCQTFGQIHSKKNLLQQAISTSLEALPKTNHKHKQESKLDVIILN